MTYLVVVTSRRCGSGSEVTRYVKEFAVLPTTAGPIWSGFEIISSTHNRLGSLHYPKVFLG